MKQFKFRHLAFKITDEEDFDFVKGLDLFSLYDFPRFSNSDGKQVAWVYYEEKEEYFSRRYGFDWNDLVDPTKRYNKDIEIIYVKKLLREDKLKRILK